MCVFTRLTELYLFTCYTDGMFQSKFPFKDNKVLSYHIVYFLMDKRKKLADGNICTFAMFSGKLASLVRFPFRVRLTRSGRAR